MWYAHGVFSHSLPFNCRRTFDSVVPSTVKTTGRGRLQTFDVRSQSTWNKSRTKLLRTRKRPGRGLIQFSWSLARVTSFEGEKRCSTHHHATPHHQDTPQPTARHLIDSTAASFRQPYIPIREWIHGGIPHCKTQNYNLSCHHTEIHQAQTVLLTSLLKSRVICQHHPHTTWSSIPKYIPLACHHLTLMKTKKRGKTAKTRHQRSPSTPLPKFVATETSSPTRKWTACG